MLHQSRLHVFWYLRIAATFAGGSFLLVYPCVGQVLPDSSLGMESSVIMPGVNTPEGRADILTGGAHRGGNLFHSFQELNVGNLQRVYFANPAGVENILSRVTGSTPSTILGTLGVLGEANLFLLNPNGIVFGPNAQLDVGGSFLASTTNSFQFSDGSEFSTTNPQLPALTITVPLGLQYGQGQAPIELAGPLSVADGNSLTLVGSDITSQGSLTAPGGQVEVLGDRIALFDQAMIDVSSPIGGGNVFIGDSYQGQGPLPKASQIYIAPTATINANAVTTGHGGNVVVWANNTNHFYGNITARGGAEIGDGGLVKVGTQQTLVFQGTVDTTAAFGKTGTLLLAPTDITVVPGKLLHSPINGGNVWTETKEEAIDQRIGSDIISTLLNSNNLTFRADDEINFQSGSSVTATNSNTLRLHARTINLSNAVLTQAGGGSIILDTMQNQGTSAQSTQRTSVLSSNSIISTDINTQGTSIVTGSGIININAETDTPGKSLQGGDIHITTENLSLTNGSRISANAGGQGNAGNIYLTVSETAIFDGAFLEDSRNSGVFSIIQNGLDSQGGNINLSAKNLRVTNGAQLVTGVSSGTGVAGNLRFIISETSTFDGSSSLALPVLSGALSSIGEDGSGKGGNLELTTNTLNVTNGAQLGTGLLGGTGESGSMSFTVRGKATFNGTTPDGQFPSGAFSSVEPGSIGPGGNLELTAETLTVTNGAILSASTFGIGNAGSVKLFIRKTATFDGVPPSSRFPTGAYSSVEQNGLGQGGNLEITADTLTISNGAILSARTLGAGRAGSISLNVNTFTASTGGQVQATTSTSSKAGDIVIEAHKQMRLTDLGTGIFANTAPGSTGDSGNIILAPRVLWIQDGAEIAVDSQGEGIGGNINIQVERLELNRQGAITAETASNQGGNITLKIKDLLTLRQNSVISATAGNTQAGGDGGNITIQAPFIVGVLRENSDITANAFSGQGGSINVVTNSIYGLEFQPQITPFSDITASSQLGISGTVTIQALNLDPTQGVIALPTNFTDSSQIIATTCVADQESSFAITGRGGVPEDPRQPLLGPVLWQDERSGEKTDYPLTPLNHIPSSPASMVEAQSWIIDRDGKILLVAEQSDNHPGAALRTPGCALSQVSP